MPFIKTRDDVSLFYQDWGSGEAVVFLHAWAMHSDMWENQMLYLNENGIRCIAYDRRGHGRSDRPGYGHNYDVYADDLEDLLSQLHLNKVRLVGHSMGSGVIVRYLSRYGSGRVSRIVLMAPAMPYLLKTQDNPEGAAAEFFEATRAAIRKDFPKWLTDNSDGFYLPGRFDVSQATTQWTINLILSNSLKAVIEGARQVAETDFRKELQGITLPALVIHGSADASIPVQFGRRTAEYIPGCLYKEYEGAPHGLFLTHIDSLTKDILQFIGS